MPRVKLKVLVICGGKSAERDVSLTSASAILRNLDQAKYDIRVVVIDANGRWTLPGDLRRAGLTWSGPGSPGKRAVSLAPEKSLALSLPGIPGFSPPDVVLPVLHGPNGEDGTVQGLLELANVAYVGCGVLGSAIAMDKEFPKRIAPGEGVDILPYAVIRTKDAGTDYDFLIKRLGLPLFVKPSRMGSSVGVSKVGKKSELIPALRLAGKFDDKIVLEKGIDAREIEVAVLGDSVSAEASVCGEIRVDKGFYDYETKYRDPAAAKLIIPAEIPARTARKARDWAVRMFHALEGYGMSRVDFLLDKKTGRLYYNETNTIPGFTEISLYPRMWEASGLPFPKLLDRLLALALLRHRRKSAFKTKR